LMALENLFILYFTKSRSLKTSAFGALVILFL